MTLEQKRAIAERIWAGKDGVHQTIIWGSCNNICCVFGWKLGDVRTHCHMTFRTSSWPPL